MEFNHLDDTRFPNFDTVHPYQFKNEFDYSRWVPGTRIKACNVPWDYAYENVVKFDTDAERDSYFDSIEQNRIEILNVDARVLPENYVKLPIPFDMMAGYNYLVIDIPIATGSEPIDYESGTGFRRWHFFITDMQYLAPNSTQIFVQLDVWTQFINSVDIPYMMLERGHAPVAATNVDDFLADPLANNAYLLAPDVNYGEASITAKAENRAFMSGRKWICLVTVYNGTAMASPDTYFGKRVSSTQFQSGTPYYTDAPERWGYKATPNDYGFGNGYSYLNCRSNTSLYNETQTLAPNNVQIYAIEAEDCFTRKSEHGNEGFFERVFRDRPTFTNGILAMFMVGESMIDLDNTYFTIDTFRLYRVKQQYVSTMRGIQLDKNDFAMPSEIADFAKLYTYPYSSIELSDNDGNKREIRIEDISGDNKLICMTSLAFPYLNFRTLFSGIGGKHEQSRIVWSSLNGSTLPSMNLWESDWEETSLDFEIPTFALYQTQIDDYMAHTFNRAIRNAIEQYWTAYTTSAMEANTAKENADDSANTSKVNADNLAQLQYRQQIRIGAAARDNSYNARDLTYSANSKKRQLKLDVNGARQSTENTLVTEQNGNDTAIRSISATTAYDIMTDAHRLMIATQTANADTTVATTEASGLAQVIGGVGSGLASAAGAAGMAVSLGVPTLGVVALAALPALTSTIGAGVNASVNNDNATIITQASALVTQATISHNSYKNGKDQTEAYNREQYIQYMRNRANVENHNMQDLIIRLENDADLELADEALNADTANADNSYGAVSGNAADAQAIYMTNADNTYRLSISNTFNTREVAIANLQAALLAARDTGIAQMQDAANAAAISISSYGGDMSGIANKSEALTIRIKKQSDSALRMAGSMFARYGYMLNQIWNVMESGLNLMRHFTYWKAGDIWLVSSNGGNAAQNDGLRDIFRNGVTVWRNPDDLGGVSIYDN